MAEKRSVGRPSKNVLRITLRLDTDSPTTKRLVSEASQLGVSLQDHIKYILATYHLSGMSPPVQPIPPLPPPDTKS